MTKYEIPLRILKKLVETPQILKILSSLSISSKDIIIVPLNNHEVLSISLIGVDVVIKRYSMIEIDELFKQVFENLKSMISLDYPENFISVYIIKDDKIDSFSLSTRDLPLLEEFLKSTTKEIDQLPDDIIEKVRFNVNYGEATLFKSSKGIFAKVIDCDIRCSERLLKLGIEELEEIDNLKEIDVYDIINILKAFSV